MAEASSSKHILIVEDERSLSGALQAKLKKEGYTVSVAEDGEHAVELAKETDFDLILLDVIMPKMDGFTVLKQLKEYGITAPVFILSNLGQAEDAERAKELGAAEYMVKANSPFTVIMKKIRAALGS